MNEGDGQIAPPAETVSDCFGVSMLDTPKFYSLKTMFFLRQGSILTNGA
ncbi:MAG: hypothetical protein ACR2H5_03295 [Ktedonobacteraceae bacterium]